MATTLICPKCGGDMQEHKKNEHVCVGCGVRLEQLSLDDKRRHKIIRQRLLAGYETATAAATKLGVTPVHLREVERGAYSLSVGMIATMTVVYGCERGDLID